jgi:DNA-binding winged helix-turn-helix (wHTH) protein/tetratricopeptide (TPR) repeat protein
MVDGRVHSLEPRMMQVLVTLAKANGQVVTRAELVELCWEGRVVGDDSLNRVIWRLRQLSRSLGSGAFEVETIARVGFRLEVPGRAAAPPEPASIEARLARPSRRTLLAGGAAAAGLASLGAFAWVGGTAHAPNPDAKRFYERAMQLRGQAALSQAEQSIPFLKEATRIDPDYAEAWGALGWAYRSLLDYGPRADEKRLLISARSAADRALELDPDDADARVTMLELQPRMRRWGDQERGFRAILAKHPDHGVAQYRLVDVLSETGRWSETIAPLRRLIDRQPFWPLVRWRLAESLLSAGRVDEAEDEVEVALRLWPRKFELWQMKVRLLLATGRDAEALDFAADRIREPEGATPFVHCERVIAAAHGASSDEPRQQAIELIRQEGRKGEFPLCFPAAASAFVGEIDLAFQMFEGDYFGRGPWRANVDKDAFTFPLFRFETKSLRSDPRFDELVRAIGLEAYWQSSGKMPDYRLA